MEYTAIAKNIKISPRKVRLVVDGVKRQPIKAALSSLSVMNKRASGPIAKAVNSAVANAKNNFNVNVETLSIKDIQVTEGTVLKRYHFAARGRVRPYKRRSSHIRVILTDGQSGSKISEPVQTKSVETKAIPEKAESKKKGKEKGK